jgi:hypothetical protein
MSGEPAWWSWEPELSPHLLKRMVDRQFNEVDLRAMLENSDSFRSDIEPGRWIVETQHGRRRWEVIVEPLVAESILLVITAYPVD